MSGSKVEIENRDSGVHSPSKRKFILGTIPVAITAPLMAACSPESDSGSQYETDVLTLRRPIPANTESHALVRELVRYATLAPSSHNTQCWTFRLDDRADRTLAIEADLSRRCPVVDPDDHHLFVSLGCATENLAHAALAHGFKANARFDPAEPGRIEIRLDPTAALSSSLFLAIPARQCTRGDYDGKPLSDTELRLLETAGSGQGVHIRLVTQRAEMERVIEYVVAGNTAQMSNPAFIHELKTWIRFNADDADQTGDGLYSATSGNPGLPKWLGSRAMDLFFRAQSGNKRYVRQIRNAAGIAIFLSEGNDRAHWIEAGRCYERFALQATALGIRNAMLNQPVEVGTIRPQFASAFGLGTQRPDLIVRFGRGPTMPYSMRRRVQSVLA